MDAAVGRRPVIVLVCLAICASALAFLASLEAGAGPAHASGANVYLPLGLQRFGNDFPVAPTAEAPPRSPTVSPSSTPTPAPSATFTPPASPTAGPSPTPTLPGSAVSHPDDPKTIVFQIGMTNLDDPGAVWEELNGTPWFTLYGDGHVIAQHTLDPSKASYDRAQTLYEGRVSEYTVQLWLRTLVHDIGYFGLKDDYVHGRGSKPEVHLWLNTGDRSKRVSLRGFFSFERYRATEFPQEKDRLMAIVALVRSIEAGMRPDGAFAITAPYAPECYTVISQLSEGADYLADPPHWEPQLNVAGIASAAPTAASNYVDKVPGHRFVDGDLGGELRDYVVPIAAQWFPINLRASEFLAGARRHVVGVRQEVPGGSMFLPLMPDPGGWAGGVDIRRSYWYRRDPGSGSCPILPSRPLLAAGDREVDVRAIVALLRARGADAAGALAGLDLFGGRRSAAPSRASP